MNIWDESILTKIIKTAFGYDDYQDIDRVYPKKQPSITELNAINKKNKRL